MNGLPYYKAYPRDFIEGTIGMPFEIKCAYRVVLDLIYMQAGNLPDDDRYISGLLGCSVRKWKSIRQHLIDADKIQVNGDFLTNYRAVSELETLAKLQDKQRENASAPRKNNNLQKPRLIHTEPEPEPEPKGVNPLTPLEILKEVLRHETAEDFIAHRKAMKKPITHLAAKRIVSKLSGHPNPDACVDESIANGWQGIFPEKGRGNGRGSKAGDAASMAERVGAEWQARFMDRGTGDGSS